MSDRHDVERALHEFARTRDPAIRDRLIDRFRPLALHCARRYSHRGLELEDLEQVAMVGLIHAIDRFDPDHGARLSTFATRTVDGELKRHFRDRAWALRVPRSVKDLSVSVRRARSELEGDLNRVPTPTEIAERIGATVDDVLDALDAATAYRTDSIDRPHSKDDRRPDVHAAAGQLDPGLDTVSERVQVHELLAGLPDRERRILELRFFDGLTQSEIADRVGISQMHVSRLIRRTLRELRDDLMDDHSSSPTTTEPTHQPSNE